MTRKSLLSLGAAAGAVALLALAAPFSSSQAESPPRVLPAPAVDLPPATGLQTAVFAGGCFWGIQGIFEHVQGVTKAVSGYAGGKADGADYQKVSTGSTGHAESVQVTYDPNQVSYGTLLRIFFSVGLDPTEVNRQGPDIGSQYRSELFVANAEQERVARAYIAQLDAARLFERPIATRVDAGMTFFPAEGYHQDYLELHPNAPYIAFYDIPKVRALQSLFPAAWRDKPVTVGKLASGS
jgi:peptide-methionine (S)-S-oxide reductase